MEKIKGVNLGNWMVLEKWMKPAVFKGTQAEDEDTLCRVLDREELEKRLKEHRDSWITKDDFYWLKEKGMNTVRIPVPHFIFGDDPVYCTPYVACAEYLDCAFEWAQETGLKILVDVHTAPECQNGFDNGGICGVCKWHQDEKRIARQLEVIRQLGMRYGHHEALWGIELLNEPISEAGWYLIKDHFHPADQKRAEGSNFVPLSVLFDFYKRGYEILRPILGEDKKIVFHDGFRPEPCAAFIVKEKMENVVLDLHWYFTLGDFKYYDNETDYMDYLMHTMTRRLERLEKAVPVIMGEWSLTHNMQEGTEEDALKKAVSYRMIGAMQLLAWNAISGWFFWNYKTEDAPDGWSFLECVEKGWLPGDYH